ncbi:hypothetical protein C8A05DRAFT_35490, partial [Staphylotrichum tortipilum]
REYGVVREDAREGGLQEPVVEEVRRLVFLRERERDGEGRVVGGTGERRAVKAAATPEFTFTLRPDATLLFHFSALTYNAHAIHLDPDYARNIEGYKERLVHGPLTLTLSLAALRACLAKLQPAQGNVTVQQRTPYVKSFTYRNLAPLYAGEELTVCLRRRKKQEAEDNSTPLHMGGQTGASEGGDSKTSGDELAWDVWIEGLDGGLAVKGRAVTTGVGQEA